MTAGFREVVLLFPLAVIAHVVEEWPQFPRWARRWASPLYSDREYLLTHAIAVSAASASALVTHWYPARWIVYTFFAVIFGPGVLWNAVFHLWASRRTRTYCPGVVTGLFVYVPLSATLVWRAIAEGFIDPWRLSIVLIVAAMLHTAEVGHTVFKRW